MIAQRFRAGWGIAPAVCAPVPSGRTPSSPPRVSDKCPAVARELIEQKRS
jgi:hypothetical protein